MQRRKRGSFFELIVKPINLGGETHQHSGRLAVADDDDLLAFGFAQKPREMSFISDNGTRVTPDLRIALGMPRTAFGHDSEDFDCSSPGASNTPDSRR